MIDGTVGPDATVMATDDAGDGGEADAFEVLVTVEAVEGVEEFVGVVHVEAGTVVADEPDFLGGIPADVDDGVGFFGGELDGVAHKVFEGDSEEFGVGVGVKAGLDVEGEVTAGVFVAKVFGDGVCEGCEVEVFAGDLGGVDFDLAARAARSSLRRACWEGLSAVRVWK